MSVFIHLLVVGAGGALGAMSRYIVIQYGYYLLKTHPAYGVLTVNVIGSFLIGFAALFMTNRFPFPISDLCRAALIVGFLGGFTTFSSYSLEIVEYFQHGQLLKAMIYALSSVVICVIATFGGISIAKWLG